MSISTDIFYMQAALRLALKAGDWTHPNPRVGCVIVKGNRIVGKGYHRRFGSAHAEINALRAAGTRSVGATLYVTLEPCNHFGKTPPCTDAIISSGIRRVVIATPDPNPQVAGKGIKKLRSQGLTVRVGVMKELAIELNKEFYFAHSHKIPFVAAKSAATMDGMISETKERGVTVLLMKDLSFLSFRRLLRRLYSLGITSILVEGGGRTISSFVDSGVIQRLHLFIAPIMLGKGIPLFQRRKSLYISASESFSLKKTSKFNGDLYAEWEVER